MPIQIDNPPAAVQQLSKEELAQQTPAKVEDLLKEANNQDFSKMSLSALGVETSTPLSSYRVVFAKDQIKRQVSSASVFATRQIDTDGDGNVTAGELRKYSYVADQSGNRDGKLSVGEYNQLFSRGIQESLLATARTVGLPERSQQILGGRFATGQFGLTGATGLPDAIDIAQSSRDSLTTAEKSIVAAQFFERAAQNVPKESQAALMKVWLEHLSSTGVTLAPVKKQKDGKLLLAGDSVDASPGPKGSTAYRAKSEIYEFSPTTGTLTSVEVQTSETPITLVKDDAYHYTSKESNPFLEREMERTLQKLQKDTEVKQLIDKLKLATQTSAPPPRELQDLLLPISRKLQEALSISPSIPLDVKVRNPENPQTLAVYSHPKPGSGQAAKIEIFATPFLSQAAEESKRLTASGMGRDESIARTLGEMRRGILSSLVEEIFHAKQHTTIDSHNADPTKTPAAVAARVADYALNREFLVSPINLKAYFGNSTAYENQPIEADAKKYRGAIVDALLDAS